MKNVELLFTLAKERNAAQAVWNRHMTTLASGGLALLVGLAPDAPEPGAARYFLAAAWVLLGGGILSGAAVMYGEVSRARRLTTAVQCQLERDPAGGSGGGGPQAIVARPARIYAWCRSVMVASLLGAVLALVTFAVMRTLG